MRSNTYQIITLATFFSLFGGLASAANISFQSAVGTDGQVQPFTFYLSSPAIVTNRTFAYAGGANANGTATPGSLVVMSNGAGKRYFY